jgi:hypothetical protein
MRGFSATEVPLTPTRQMKIDQVRTGQSELAYRRLQPPRKFSEIGRDTRLNFGSNIGSNLPVLRRSISGLNGAESTVSVKVNSRMLLYNLRGTLWIFGGTAARKADALNLMRPFTRPLCTPEAFSWGPQTFIVKRRYSRWRAQTVSSANPLRRQALSWMSWNASFAYFTYLC